MTTVSVARTSTTREWNFNLSDAPKVSFGLAGALVPCRASVIETNHNGYRNVTIKLTAEKFHTNVPGSLIFWGTWRAPNPSTPNPSDYGYSGYGHIDDLPSELVDAVLAACSLTIPTNNKENDE